jgi:flagellar biosynthetic protein FliR
MNIPYDPGVVEAAALVSVRILAFILIAPPFSHQSIPLQIKGMLAIVLAVVVAPQAVREAGAHYTAAATSGAFIIDLVTEAVTGAVLGFLVFLVFSAIQTAGALLDSSGGLQAAQQYDPAADLNAAQFSRLFQMTALALLFASDGYQLVIGGLARSFTAIPLTMSVDWSVLTQTLTRSVTQLLVAALQIAGPIMAVLFVANAALGLLSRVAPALNAYSLGPPALVLLTVVLCGIGIVALPSIVQVLAEQAVHAMGVG